MSQVESGDWVYRLSNSIRDHESTRRRSRAQPPRYEIRGELGRGGMGVIYRAWDSQLGREVALKVLSQDAADSAEARERFLREAQLAAQLTHPNIVPVYDSGEHEGQIFLAMQLIDGPTLDRSKLELKVALAALRDAARAVQHAHERGIIHRDLKPSNLMIDGKGRVYVADFGLARRSDGEARLTLSGCVMGTPAYMPPEQARGQSVDARSDVYSLGATMYEVLSGRPPFSGPNGLDVMKAVLLDEPPFPRRHNPAIPRDVEAVIVKAMSKNPSARYATAGELADDLDHWLKGEAVRAPMRGTLYRLRKKVLRHRWRVMAAGSFAALIGIVVISTWIYSAIIAGHDAERLQTEVLRAIEDGRFDHAREKNRDLRSLRPDLADLLDPRIRDAEILHGLRTRFDDHLAREQWDAAESVLKDVRNRFPTEADPLAVKLRQGRIAWLSRSFDTSFNGKDFEAAKRYISQLRDLDDRVATRFQKQLDDATGAINADEVLELVNKGLELVSKWKLEEAAGVEGALRKRGKTEAADNLARTILEKRFALGITELDQLAGGEDALAFERRYTELSGDIYRDQAERGKRLGEAALAFGLRRAEAGDHAAAVRWLKEAEVRGALAYRLFERRSLAHAALKQWEEAQKDYQSFLTRRPPGTPKAARFSEVEHSLARKAMETKDWARAIVHLDEALRLDPANAAAHHDRGLVRFRVTDLKREALDDLDNALKGPLVPEVDREYGTIAAAYACDVAEKNWKLEPTKRREAFAEAVGRLNRVAEKVRGHPKLLLERAKMQRRLGAYEAALADAAAIEGPEALRLRGQIDFLAALAGRKDEARLEKALKTLDEAVNLDPKQALSHYWRGTCRYEKGDHEGALKDLETALSIDSSLADAYFQRATIQSHARNWKEVDGHATQALALAGGLSEDEFVAARYESRGLSFESAVREFRRDLHGKRAGARYYLEQFQPCVDDALAALKLDPAFARAHLLAGSALLRLGKKPEARPHFQWVVQNGTDPEEKKRAGEGLKECD